MFIGSEETGRRRAMCGTFSNKRPKNSLETPNEPMIDPEKPDGAFTPLTITAKAVKSERRDAAAYGGSWAMQACVVSTNLVF